MVCERSSDMENFSLRYVSLENFEWIKKDFRMTVHVGH